VQLIERSRRHLRDRPRCRAHSRRGGDATGVRLVDGETSTPQRRDRERDADAALRALLEARRAARPALPLRRSEMQIHFALSEPPRWEGDERLARTAIVHLTPALDGVSRAVNEADARLLPAEATVVVGQPLTIDPSRAPEGKGLLWIQLQELPWHVKGDAAGELDTGRQLDRGARASATPIDPGADLRATSRTRVAILKRVASRRADLQAANSTSTTATPTRLARARPEPVCGAVPGQPRAPTPVKRLWQIAQHPPGAGHRRRLRDARSEAPARAPVARAHQETSMSGVSISQITTVGQPFADDLDAYRAAGADGIGIWESSSNTTRSSAFRESGLAAATAVPAVPSILPLPLMEGPEDPEQRIEAIRAGSAASRRSSRRACSF
jgi:hypothetical protein